MFFLFIGVIAALVFAASNQLGEPEFTYCLAGMALIALGAVLVYRNRPSRDPAERFRTLGKMRNRKKKK